MLIKIGTLTNPDIDDIIEHINAAKQSKPTEDNEEVEVIHSSIQTLYYNSDTKEFFRGYNNSITLHYQGLREYIKKVDLRKSHIISKAYDGDAVPIPTLPFPFILILSVISPFANLGESTISASLVIWLIC